MVQQKRRRQGETCRRLFLFSAFLAVVPGACAAPAAGTEKGGELLRLAPDPYGYPRPADGERNVPVDTSFYLELKAADARDPVLTGSLELKLSGESGATRRLLRPGVQFEPGGRGILRNVHNWRAGADTRSVYVEPGRSLEPSTRYTASVTARTVRGVPISSRGTTWSFTTEPSTTAPVPLAFSLDLTTAPVLWHGGFFTGFCKPGFCTGTAYDRSGSYRLMEEVRRQTPKAWSLQRDWHVTGTEYNPPALPQYMPNVVRELETRRVASMVETTGGVVLRVEDFFGHEQYGIPSGRPVSPDYAPGHEVLITDGDQSCTATVVAVDSATSTVIISALTPPPARWKTAYRAPLPEKENPDVPGLFPPGGCYLLKSRPSGAPRFYWGRFDKELDLTIGKFGRRQVVSFCEAPGDLSRDGRPGNTAKDYAELHEVVRLMTSRLLDRYGARCLDFTWSVLNEPDLGFLFFRAEPEEIERFYDYTTDAILRAFEDHGYDSSQVFVGGLELGLLPLSRGMAERFLAHCSPKARHPEALAVNAAFSDPRLDGRRSRRTEALCRANGGKGTPCDFISVHAYNSSAMMARKLREAKEWVLRIDPDFYLGLWVNSHESCPDWAPPDDPAASDSYLGNGYFATWCADVVRRQIDTAAKDRRFAFGETILTIWPWEAAGFRGSADCFHQLAVDENGDGTRDRSVTVPLPVFHAVSFVAGMGDTLWPLPELRNGGQTVSGFASRRDNTVFVLLYSHQPADVQSRARARSEIRLSISGMRPGKIAVTSTHLDQSTNSVYRELKCLQREERKLVTAGEAERLEKLASLQMEPVILREAGPDGVLFLPASLPSNGMVLLKLEPEGVASK